MLPTMDLLKELSQVKINLEDMFTISSVQYLKYFLIESFNNFFAMSYELLFCMEGYDILTQKPY